MPLMTQIFQLCKRVNAKGWGAYFDHHFGLKIDQPNEAALAAELNRNLQLPAQAFQVSGFDDLARSTVRAIEPADPARSLLYHAFASPGVKPTFATDPDSYLSLEELETLENFVWVAGANGIAAPNLATVRQRATAITNEIAMRRTGSNSPTAAELAVVIFSQEYRRNYESIHRKHADLCLSRTGMSRVGTHTVDYSRDDRGFWPVVTGNKKAFGVIPAKFAPYLAVKIVGKDLSTFGPLEPQGEDDVISSGRDSSNVFWVPVHKLFASANECVSDIDLSHLRFEAHHVNEKLRRVHLEFKRRGYPAETNATTLSQSPYFMKDDEIATIDVLGYVRPVAKPLVEVAKRADGTSLSFEVPRKNAIRRVNVGQTPRNDRFVTLFDYASMEISGNDVGPNAGRRAPEYIHVRHKSNGQDANDNPRMEGDVTVLIGTDANPNKVLHYIDRSGDGWVTVAGANALHLSILPAYSLVAAPDFFPLVTQLELMTWAQNNGIWGTAPNVLAAQRFAANVELLADSNGGPTPFNTLQATQPQGSTPVFKARDNTLTAVVGLSYARSGQPLNFPVYPNPFVQPEVKRQHILPDAGAGVFAPGWDISRSPGVADSHLAAYGLGSPFPEDSKLCAALSGFWPAAAPDTAITFNFSQQQPIKIPMLDNEIKGDNAWDGVQGPKRVGNEVIHPNPTYVDYVTNAMKNLFSLADTAEVTTAQYIARMQAIIAVNNRLNDESYRILSFTTNNQGGFRVQCAKIDESTARTKDTQNPDVAQRHRLFRSKLTEVREITVDRNNAVIADQRQPVV